MRYLLQRQIRRIALAAFNHTNIVTVNSCLVCKFRLRKSFGFSLFSDDST